MTDYDLLVQAAEKIYDIKPPRPVPPELVASLTWDKVSGLGSGAQAAFLKLQGQRRI